MAHLSFLQTAPREIHKEISSFLEDADIVRLSRSSKSFPLEKLIPKDRADALCRILDSNGWRTEALPTRWKAIFEKNRSFVRSIKWQGALSNSTLSSIASSFVKLQHLHLASCEHITDAGIQAISSLPLRSLSLRYRSAQVSEHYSISDKALEYLSLGTISSTLRVLDLHGCKRIYDEGVSFIKNFPLQSLDLSDTSITNQAVEYLHEGRIRDTLRHLQLSRCFYLQEEVVLRLKDFSLRSLNLYSLFVGEEFLKQFANGAISNTLLELNLGGTLVHKKSLRFLLRRFLHLQQLDLEVDSSGRYGNQYSKCFTGKQLKDLTKHLFQKPRSSLEGIILSMKKMGISVN